MIPRRTFIKICGIRDAATAVLAAEAGADAIGVVFAPGSPRIITLEVARQIARAVPRAVQRVGLFVDAPVPYVRTIAVEVGLSVVQLHGRELARDIAALAPLPVWKAVGLSTGDPGTALAPWRKRPENLAALLLDVAGPGDAPAGGTGRLLDWNALTEIRANGLFDGLPPLVLAGGLTPHNVGQAVRLLRPWGVDVSSGVERRRGEKDATLIREFCQAVQAADAAS